MKLVGSMVERLAEMWVDWKVDLMNMRKVDSMVEKLVEQMAEMKVLSTVEMKVDL